MPMAQAMGWGVALMSMKALLAFPNAAHERLKKACCCRMSRGITLKMNMASELKT